MTPTALLLLALALSPTDDPASSWPHLRGPSCDGRAEGGAVFEEQELGLAPRWTVTLGPSYSGVAVADGRAVTTFSAEGREHVVALDAGSGARLWAFELGETYLGHDGSEDGPIATPAAGGGAVFAVDPRGRLVALGLEKGDLLWEKDLSSELGTEVPEYGFGSSPLYVAGSLIVQAGGSEGRGVVALDAATGAVRWSALDGEAGYTSPVLMELAGRAQLVVLDGDEIVGLAPEDGAVLWRQALGERGFAGTGVATRIDADRFVAPVSGQLAAFEVSAGADGFLCRELWRTRDLGRGYSAPVHHDGLLYGLNGGFLTCVDAETGERVWKSRPPGGDGLIGVEDRLVVFGAEGFVALARAEADGYVEESRAHALSRSSLVWPSFANDRVYVRNAEGVTCLAVVPASGVAEAPEEVVPDSAFARLVAGIEGTPDAQARIDAFLAEQPSFPLVEGDLVHFVYQGEVVDVAVLGSMTGGAHPAPLRRIGGTDVFWRTFAIEPGARWEYLFQVDFDQLRTDPRNELSSPGLRAGQDMSVVATPGYRFEHHHEASGEGDHGTLETLEFESRALGNTRALTVYLPAGYEAGSGAYPLLLVHDGPDWLAQGGLAHTLDAVIGRSVRPLVAVFVSPIDAWWYEAGGSGTERYLDMLADELVPFLSGRYRLSGEPAERALVGLRGFGLTAAYGVLLRPDTFGRAACQSVSLGDVARHGLLERLAAGPRAEGAVFYVDWSRYEMRDPDRGYDFRADSRRLHAGLVEAGYEVFGGETLDGAGWGSWRARSDDWLAALFPLE